MRYRNLVRIWLTGIIFIFPFIKVIQVILLRTDIRALQNVFQFLDEITILVIFPLAIWELVKKKEIFDHLYLALAVPIVTFALYGMISGSVNGNMAHITLLGTIDYIKYFFIIFIYAAFYRDCDGIEKIFRGLVVVCIIMSMFAVIEELWALVFRYGLHKGLLDPSVYLLRKPPNDISMAPGIWRFGILRTSSLMMKNDWLGYMNLFTLTIYLFRGKRINPYVCVLIVVGILLTLSRSAYGGLLVVVLFWLLLRKMKNTRTSWVIIAVVMMVVAVVSTNFISINVDQHYLQSEKVMTYREYARNIGMDIWFDHFFMGAGPGKFGGIVSMRFLSPLYKQYNFSMGLLKRIGGIDQFWPQVFAETGIIGFLLFALILIALISILNTLRQNNIGRDHKNMLTGLAVFLMVIFVYTMSTGMNTTAIIFPYYAFIGICLGSAKEADKIRGPVKYKLIFDLGPGARKFAINAALSIFVAVIFLAVCEITLRYTHLFRARISWAEPDPMLGWSNTPGSTYWQFKENDHPIIGKINSYGFRDKEWSLEKSKDTYRIAVLGDSYVEALQVEPERTFLSLTEQDLNRNGDRKVELMNFGQSGFTQSQELIVLVNKILDFSPDLVALFFVPSNDIQDINSETATSKLRPFITIDSNGKLLLDTGFTRTFNYKLKSILNPLKQRSTLISLIMERYNVFYSLRFSKEKKAMYIPRYLSLSTSHPDSVYERNYRLNRSLIKAMNDICKENGIRFMLVTINSSDTYIPEIEEHYKSIDPSFNAMFFEEDMGQLAESLGIDYLGLHSAFRDSYVKTGITLHWGHWNYKGHELVAEELAKKLKQIIPSNKQG